MKALKKKKKPLSGGAFWGEKKKKNNPKTKPTTIKRPYLASSQDVLALALNGLLLAQQYHSDLRVSGLWVAVCLDKSRIW